MNRNNPYQSNMNRQFPNSTNFQNQNQNQNQSQNQNESSNNIDIQKLKRDIIDDLSEETVYDTNNNNSDSWLFMQHIVFILLLINTFFTAIYTYFIIEENSGSNKNFFWAFLGLSTILSLASLTTTWYSNSCGIFNAVLVNIINSMMYMVLIHYSRDGTSEYSFRRLYTTASAVSMLILSLSFYGFGSF